MTRKKKQTAAVLFASLLLLGQMVLGPLAQALPCPSDPMTCGHCPDRATDVPDTTAMESHAEHQHGDSMTTPAAPEVPDSSPCGMHLAGSCTAIPSVAVSAKSAEVWGRPATEILARYLIPAFNDPQFEFLRPPA